jgi:alpha-L-fucosidase
MLGVAPDSRGLLPDSDVARLKEFGAAIHSLQTGNLALQHLATTPETAAALDGNTDTFWSAPPGSHHAVLEADFAKPMSIDRVTSMEWLNDGQHVEKYAVEVWMNNTWKSVASGQAIGHEKIDRFAPVITNRIRLNILSSSQEAHIREFQVYSDGPKGKTE